MWGPARGGGVWVMRTNSSALSNCACRAWGRRSGADEGGGRPPFPGAGPETWARGPRRIGRASTQPRKGVGDQGYGAGWSRGFSALVSLRGFRRRKSVGVALEEETRAAGRRRHAWTPTAVPISGRYRQAARHPAFLTPRFLGAGWLAGAFRPSSKICLADAGERGKGEADDFAFIEDGPGRTSPRVPPKPPQGRAMAGGMGRGRRRIWATGGSPMGAGVCGTSLGRRRTCPFLKKKGRKKLLFLREGEFAWVWKSRLADTVQGPRFRNIGTFFGIAGLALIVFAAGDGFPKFVVQTVQLAGRRRFFAAGCVFVAACFCRGCY